MTISNFIIIVAIGVLITSIIFDIIFEKKRLRRYWSRTCTGTEWRKQFPNVTKDSIRAFLECFVDEFAFSSKRRLKFTPDDKIMDVYRAIYPTKGWSDSLELETFSINLEKKYRIDLGSVLTDDLTLGQLFLLATEAEMKPPEEERDADKRAWRLKDIIWWPVDTESEAKQAVFVCFIFTCYYALTWIITALNEFLKQPEYFHSIFFFPAILMLIIWGFFKKRQVAAIAGFSFFFLQTLFSGYRLIIESATSLDLSILCKSAFTAFIFIQGIRGAYSYERLIGGKKPSAY
jgi:propanediol dehydratase small subunit